MTKSMQVKTILPLRDTGDYTLEIRDATADLAGADSADVLAIDDVEAPPIVAAANGRWWTSTTHTASPKTDRPRTSARFMAKRSTLCAAPLSFAQRSIARLGSQIESTRFTGQHPAAGRS